MKDSIPKKRKKYALTLLAVTSATIGTSFSPSAPWVMASSTFADGGMYQMTLILQYIRKYPMIKIRIK